MERGTWDGGRGTGDGDGERGKGDGGRGMGDRKRVRGTRNGPAVIGHSCCGVPANVLSVCLFVFFAKRIKLNKIKLKIKRRIGKEVTGGVGVQVRFCIQVFIFAVPFSSPLL